MYRIPKEPKPYHKSIRYLSIPLSYMLRHNVYPSVSIAFVYHRVDLEVKTLYEYVQPVWWKG